MFAFWYVDYVNMFQYLIWRAASCAHKNHVYYCERCEKKKHLFNAIRLFNCPLQKIPCL